MAIVSIMNRVEELVSKLKLHDITFLLAVNIEINKFKRAKKKIIVAMQCIADYPPVKDYVLEFYLKDWSGKLRCVSLYGVGKELQQLYLGRSLNPKSKIWRTVIAGGRYFDTNPSAELGRRKELVEKVGIQCSVIYPINKSGAFLVSKKTGAGDKKFDLHELKLFQYYADLILGPSIDLALDNEKNFTAALRDSLTGLYNHGYFVFQLNREVSIHERSKKDLSLIMVDIDFFKHYNDLNGHLKGDKLLVELARILVDNVRKTDTVARYGGEEFVIILPNTKLKWAVKKAEDIRKTVEDYPFERRETQPFGKVTLSIGVATKPLHAALAIELVAKADSALYYSKMHGRNMVSVFNPLSKKSIS